MSEPVSGCQGFGGWPGVGRTLLGCMTWLVIREYRFADHHGPAHALTVAAAVPP